MLVEPGRYALNHVTLMARMDETVALMLIHHQLGLHAQRLERMPEFVRLRRGTFTVTVANEDQRGRLGFFDKSNRRALGIDLRIVIDRSAEERDHPLVDLV